MSIAEQPAGTKQHIAVVGGTRGAGRVTAEVFQAAGSAVSVIARKLPTGAEAKAGLTYWAADVTGTGPLKRALEKARREHGNLTGLVFFQRFRGTGDTWLGEMETGLGGTKRTIDMLVDEFELCDCSIVVVSSINAYLISGQVSPGYHVVKAALNQLVRYYAVKLGQRGIRINSVSPGTFLKEESQSQFLQDKKRVKLYEQMIPLGRLCSAREIAEPIRFLCSGESSFITGQDIIIDGGLSLQYQEALVCQLNGTRKSRVGKA
jgi:NAD(P)-dependent dehydrogenase (short-subunit alcohol dehydrogenase family)